MLQIVCLLRVCKVHGLLLLEVSLVNDHFVEALIELLLFGFFNCWHVWVALEFLWRHHLLLVAVFPGTGFWLEFLGFSFKLLIWEFLDTYLRVNLALEPDAIRDVATVHLWARLALDGWQLLNQQSIFFLLSVIISWGHVAGTAAEWIPKVVVDILVIVHVGLFNFLEELITEVEVSAIACLLPPHAWVGPEVCDVLLDAGFTAWLPKVPDIIFVFWAHLVLAAFKVDHLRVYLARFWGNESSIPRFFLLLDLTLTPETTGVVFKLNHALFLPGVNLVARYVCVWILTVWIIDVVNKQVDCLLKWFFGDIIILVSSLIFFIRLVIIVLVIIIVYFLLVRMGLVLVLLIAINLLLFVC